MLSVDANCDTITVLPSASVFDCANTRGSCTCEQLASKGFTSKSFKVRDLFAAKDLGTFTGSFGIHVPSSGIKMLKISEP